MGIPADCDICHRQFRAEPDNIIECFVIDDWDEPIRRPARDPDDYVFCCPKCEPDVVRVWDDEE